MQSFGLVVLLLLSWLCVSMNDCKFAAKSHLSLQFHIMCTNDFAGSKSSREPGCVHLLLKLHALHIVL